MSPEFPRCVVCRVSLKAEESVVFRTDGRVQHLNCPDVVCPVCRGTIKPGDPIRRDGEVMLHSNCWMRRMRAASRAGDRDDRILTALRERISVKVRAGVLPSHLPDKLHRALGGGYTCDACDERIQAAHAQYTYDSPDRRLLRLHIGCAGLWQAELLGGGMRRDGQLPEA